MKRKYWKKIEYFTQPFYCYAYLWRTLSDIFFDTLDILTHYVIDNEMLIWKWWFFSIKKIEINTIKRIEIKENEPEIVIHYIPHKICSYIMTVRLKNKSKQNFINDLTNINSKIEVT